MEIWFTLKVWKSLDIFMIVTVDLDILPNQHEKIMHLIPLILIKKRKKKIQWDKNFIFGYFFIWDLSAQFQLGPDWYKKKLLKAYHS